jgi:hypothetical protein
VSLLYQDGKSIFSEERYRGKILINKSGLTLSLLAINQSQEWMGGIELAFI